MGITYKKGKNGRKKIILILLILALELSVFLAGYFAGSINSSKSSAPEPEIVPSVEEPQITDSNTAKEKAEKILSGMELDDMVYQMMFVTPESITGVGTVIQAGEATKASLAEYPVGGIIYFSENLIDRTQTAEMIKNTQSYSEIPLFIGVDEEGGIVSRLGSNSEMGTTKHPPMREIGDTKDSKKAYCVGETLAKELVEIGFNVDFAPVADVIVNESNTEIGTRSFGTDPELVTEMVKNTLLGMENNGLSATLKHFPGHGSTVKNSHMGTSESYRTMEELKACELKPFIEGINQSVDFIMISHLTLTNATEEKLPSSMSKEVITELLKNELGYKGIVITDALNMGAIANLYSSGEAAVKAVEAGNDMILMPIDVKAAHDGIMNAVKEGRISEERIKESARKILILKAEKNLI